MKSKFKSFTSLIVMLTMLVSLIGVQNPAYVLASTSSNLNTGMKRVSVHDPSIVVDTNPESESKYYVFGSHISGAKSNNLMDWTALHKSEYETPTTNWLFGDINTNLAESFLWAGYDDGDCAGGKYAVWAPDVFWNKDYNWGADSEYADDPGAYMIYYSASSTWRRSCIGYAVSKDIEGPYEYVDTVIYSGFTNVDSTDGNSTRNTNWNEAKIDSTDENLTLRALIESKVSNVEGVKWFDQGGGWNNNYAPNAIDATIFYNADESKLYMVYGSWSGGIFLLELDKATGAVKYPGTDSQTEDGRVIDRYFGTKLLGGNHESGEGPYIVYDSVTKYYYLYVTYGGLAADGGYNIRLFRSESPDGPYVDAAGKEAKYNAANHEQYGVKLIGNYQLYGQTIGYRAGGHNSSFIDENGQMYLVYHTRFNFNNGGESAYPWGAGHHELRIHQMFMNKNGWPVTAPYEYNKNDKIDFYSNDSVIGTYEFINHGSTNGTTMIPSQIIHLNSDGTVTGEAGEGTWSKSGGNGYNYISLKIGNTTYEGVLFEQTSETVNPEKVMTFSAIGNDNTSVWGSKLDFTDQVAVERIANILSDSVPKAVKDNITLPASASGGVSITWSSNKPAIISNNGEVNRATTDSAVTMTATLTKGSAKIARNFTIEVKGLPYVEKLTVQPFYRYDFESSTVSGSAISNAGTVSDTSDATLMGNVKIVKDEEDDKRENVIHIMNEPGAKQENYLKLPENTFREVGEEGFTVGMWVNVVGVTHEVSAQGQAIEGDKTLGHSALFEADDIGRGNYPMTRIGANLLARINSGEYADTAVPAQGLRDGTWEYINYTIDKTGISVYLNGKEVTRYEKDIAAALTPDKDGNLYLRNAVNVKVGSGHIWNDEDVRNAKFDNVAVFNQALTEAEVRALYWEEAGIEPIAPPTDPTYPSNPSTPSTPSTPVTETTPAPNVTVDNEKNTVQVETNLSEQKTENNTVSAKVEIPANLRNSIDKDKDATIVLPTKELLESAKQEGINQLNITVEIPTAVLDNIKITNITLNKNLIEAAITSNKVITAAITDETGEILCKWTFDGTKTGDAKKAADVNLWMNTGKTTENTAIQNVIKKDGKNEEGVVLDFSHSGTLPVDTKVSVKVTNQMFQSGDKVYMYYYNSKTKKLDELPKTAYTIDKNGFINATITHCSQYVLLAEKADDSILTPLIDQVTVKLSKTLLKVDQRAKVNLTVPEGATYKVTYSSNKKSVAAVSKKGSIRAKKKGSAVISVTVKINGESKVFKKKVTVK